MGAPTAATMNLSTAIGAPALAMNVCKPLVDARMITAPYYCHGHGRAFLARISSSANEARVHARLAAAVLASSASASASPPSPVAAASARPACEVVKEFYAGINRGDLDSVRELIAEDCVYEDLVFPRPYVGRKDILDFFKKFTDIIGSDLQFIIDDISTDDQLCVGLTWHLEWRGKPFPFSKGCSFYRLRVTNGKPEIIYGRDSVEPALKPGDAALVGINAVVSLLRRFPKLAERF